MGTRAVPIFLFSFTPLALCLKANFLVELSRVTHFTRYHDSVLSLVPAAKLPPGYHTPEEVLSHGYSRLATAIHKSLSHLDIIFDRITDLIFTDWLINKPSCAFNSYALAFHVSCGSCKLKKKTHLRTANLTGYEKKFLFLYLLNMMTSKKTTLK